MRTFLLVVALIVLMLLSGASFVVQVHGAAPPDSYVPPLTGR